MTATPSEEAIFGEVFPATAAGFAAAIAHANDMKRKGYRLVTLVRLDKALAAVYEKSTTSTSSGSLVGE